jgi:hypothetical protein
MPKSKRVSKTIQSRRSEDGELNAGGQSDDGSARQSAEDDAAIPQWFTDGGQNWDQ